MSARAHFGWKPMPRKPRPSSSPTCLTSARCWLVSLQVWWMFSSCAPDSSNWPAGSSVTEAPSRNKAMTRPFSSTGCQPKRVMPLSRASMPCGPSNGGGDRSSSRNTNFSCSVPMRQSSLARAPAAWKAISWSLPVMVGETFSVMGFCLDVRSGLQPAQYHGPGLVDAEFGGAGEQLCAGAAGELLLNLQQGARLLAAAELVGLGQQAMHRQMSLEGDIQHLQVVFAQRVADVTHQHQAGQRIATPA